MTFSDLSFSSVLKGGSYMQFRVRLAATLVAAAISALPLAAVVATPASAAEQTSTYAFSSLCAVDSAYVGPYSPGSWYNGEVLASATPYYSDCYSGQTLPSGTVEAQAQVYKWTGSSWAYCASTGWAYGGGTANVPPYGAAFAQGHLAGTCGAGWYGVVGWGYVWGYEGSRFQWNGGSVYSGSEYYPVTIKAGAVAMTPSKQSQAAAQPSGPGVARFDKLPAETPIVDHNGQLVKDAHGNLETHRTSVSQPPVQGGTR